MIHNVNTRCLRTHEKRDNYKVVMKILKYMDRYVYRSRPKELGSEDKTRDLDVWIEVWIQRTFVTYADLISYRF